MGVSRSATLFIFVCCSMLTWASDQLPTSQFTRKHEGHPHQRAGSPLVQCPTTQVNESRICEGVSSIDSEAILQSYQAVGEVPCNITLEQYACAQIAPYLVPSIMVCKLSSNMTYSKETWKLLLNKTSVLLLSNVLHLSTLLLYMPVTLTGPSVTLVLDVVGEVGFRTIDDGLYWGNSNFISLLFSSNLRPFLPYASASLLLCLSSKNLTCETYQHIVSELSFGFGSLQENQREDVLRSFIMPFLSRNSSDSGCVSNNSTAWLLNNFGPFSVLSELRSLFDLNNQFDPLAVLDLLSPEQKAESMVLRLPHPQGNVEVVSTVLDYLLESPVERKLPEVLNHSIALARQNEAPCEFYQTMLNGSLNSATDVPEPIITRAVEELLLLVPEDCPVSKCLRTPVNESQLCDGVNSLAPELYAFGVPCNISVEQYACAQLPGFSALHLAQLLGCQLHSNITYSRGTWKLLFIKTSAVLDGALSIFSFTVSSMPFTVMSPSATNVLDVLGELRLNSISDSQWRDINFVSLLFGEGLRPFLPYASESLLLCVSSKNLSCETYQHILGELSHHFVSMKEDLEEKVLKFFTQPFLSRNPSCVPTTPFPLSTTPSTPPPSTSISIPSDTSNTTEPAVPVAETAQPITQQSTQHPNSSTQLPIPITTQPEVDSTPAPPPRPPPAPGPFSTVSFSLTFKGDYDFRLDNPTSQLYKRYENDIKSAVESNSDKLPGYKANSANVKGFRPGSIIADFSLQLTDPTISFTDASNGIINNLKAKNYDFPDNPFALSEQGKLRQTTNSLFPGQQMVLNCSGSSITEWRFNGQTVSGASGGTLTITNVEPADNGRYECVSTKNSLPFIRWERINSINPFPDMQISKDKRFRCVVGETVSLQCCVDSVYEVEMVKVADVNGHLQEPGSAVDCTYSYSIESCQVTSGTVQFSCRLTDPNLQSFDYSSRSMTLTFQSGEFDCISENFGAGNDSQVVEGNCADDEVGSVTAECQGTNWTIIEDNCVLRVIKALEEESETLTAETLPEFVDRLSRITEENSERIINSTANIQSIVNSLSNVGNISRAFTTSDEVIEDFISTSTVIVSNSTINSWSRLNSGNATRNTSASLLGSHENIVGSLQRDTSVELGTDIIQLRQTFVNSSFSDTFGINSSAAIFIPEEGNLVITTVTFSTLNNVLPTRNTSDNDSGNALSNTINGAVILLQVNDTITNISLSFDLINETLGNPQCVFWNFELFDGLGGWDSFGCELISFANNTVTCECNHTTSFSILMSPSIPAAIKLLLDFITYIGVGISLASLIICLIIEGIIWKSMTKNDTSYMRHVCVVNVAVSLLIADIWFIVGAAISDSESVAVGPCTAATFFIHFFYLSMFFWMLVSALLLLYRTVMVFSQMTKSAMMAIAFTLGYGAPLIIAVVTVAATAGGGGYIREENVCWLNWNKTKALLAFVIPALTIVAINFLVMIIVIFKMLRRGVGNTRQSDEKNSLAVIARCVAILTPLFGLTWGFGIGIMAAPEAVGLHIVFAVLNSLQGFFILVFGTLLDSKIKSALAERLKPSNSNSGATRSTRAQTSSSSALDFFRRIGRRNVYNVSGVPISSGSRTSAPYSATDSTLNT